MTQLINIAGVVAIPNWATETPLLANPATKEADIMGLDNRGSAPTETFNEVREVLRCLASHSAKDAPMWNILAGVRVTGSLGLTAETEK